MRKEEFCEILGEIHETYVKEARAEQKTGRLTWLKWSGAAACLCLIAVGIVLWKGAQTPLINSGSTLLGAEEIYPTVMVDGQLYAWRKGAAICDELPDDCVYYGELTHVEGDLPEKDCEFVSVFSVSGQIYTVLGDRNCVYLCLTTEWMTQTPVVFDLAESVE